MSSALGVYLGEKIVKYAKLNMDEKTGRVGIETYGTKYVIGDNLNVISEIITETGSVGLPVCINIKDPTYIETQIFKQISKSDLDSVISLEILDYSEKREMNDKSFSYRYSVSESLTSKDNYTSHIVIKEKNAIEAYSSAESLNIKAMYPKSMVINSLINKNESNYMIANIDEDTKLITVTGREITNVVELEIGMKEILDSIAEKLGSYTKACELCKSINVFADDSESTIPGIEEIIEPLIQEILNKIKDTMTQTKVSYQNIYLTGLINYFINIDMLFEEFLGVNTTKLKPIFLAAEETDVNIAELIEVNEATAFAYNYLNLLNEKFNFLTREKKGTNFKALFGINEEPKTSKPQVKEIKKTFAGIKLPNISLSKFNFNININKEKVSNYLLFANIILGVIFVLYTAFTTIYNSEMTEITNKVKAKNNEFEKNVSLISNDISYISKQKELYKTENDFVNSIIEKVTGQNLGVNSTYNVANFMQKIMKYIPSGVILDSISSDNNKNVVMVAKSTKYTGLGYLISQLKLQRILDNVTVTSVVNGDTITVTIGGELP